jgi:uncharacterized protein (DUF433 family)
VTRSTFGPPPLEKPVYQMNEAARLLRLPDKTLRRWIDGDRRFEKVIEPLIRPETTGSTDVTWGEFVEAGLLREYRVRRLPIERLRPLIASMRERLDTLYPLAQAKPLFSDGRQLLWREQLESDTPRSMFLVVEGGPEDGYQLMLGDIASQFVARVEFEPPEKGVVARWFPAIETTKRIVLDPRVSFGLPTINGVKTEALAELVAAGERPGKIARVYSQFGITTSDVWMASEFESRLAEAA